MEGGKMRKGKGILDEKLMKRIKGGKTKKVKELRFTKKKMSQQHSPFHSGLPREYLAELIAA